MAAPRAVLLPGESESEPPNVVQIDDHVATFAEFVTHVHPTIHATRAEARAAATHPVLYPIDGLADELADEIASAVARYLQRPEHETLLRDVLLATDHASPLLPWLAVAASLGGTPLDEFALPSEVQERASYDAAAYRARHRPMGSLSADQDVVRAWTRLRWLSDDGAIQDELATVLSALVDTEQDRLRNIELLRGLTGKTTTGLGLAVDAPEVYVGSGGAIGLARQALAAVDSAPIRTQVRRADPGPPDAVRPVVTVEPSSFFAKCTAALEALPVALRSERYGVRLERCQRGARQLERDRGAAITGSAWEDPTWPAAPPRVLPLAWSHGRPVEGLARVGFQCLDVAIDYATPPRRLDAPAAVSTGPTARTLVVPVWVPFSGDHPPTLEEVEAASALGDRAAIAAALTDAPAPRACGCAQIDARTGIFVLLALGLVRKRS